MRFLQSTILGFLVLFGVMAPLHVSAIDVGDAICSEEVTFKPEICGDIDPGKEEDAINPLYGPDGIITRAVSGLSLLIGLIAVIIIIIQGIKMTLSTGDAGQVKSARDGVIYAAVGLVVAVLAQAIVRFVLNRIGD